MKNSNQSTKSVKKLKISAQDRQRLAAALMAGILILSVACGVVVYIV